MTRFGRFTQTYRLASLTLLAGATALMLAACNAGTGNGGGGGSTDGGSDPLSYDGSVSGKLVSSSSTRGDSSSSSAQEAPPEFDTENTMVTFHGVDGEPLTDPQGNVIPAVPVNPDGSFEADGLPVGTDFTVCGDIGGDGDCDIESCVNVPADENGMTGELDDVEADPLTTLVLAKLRDIMDAKGVTPEELPFSPAVIVTRVVTAFENLFEEAGIDQEIGLAELEALSPEQLATLFESVVPAGARAGIEMAEGNLGATRAGDAFQLAGAVAEVFLRAGFPIADLPGDPDLSGLANLPNVEVMTFEEFRLASAPPPPPGDGGGTIEPLPINPDEIPPELIDSLPEGFLEDAADGTLDDFTINDIPEDLLFLLGGTELPAQDAPPPPPGPTGDERIYFSTVAEPDRNFANADGVESGDKEGVPHLPIINDFVLTRMAALSLSGATISVNDLYDVITSVDDGLGVRLTYNFHDPNFFGPPLTVFETEDGQGKAISLDEIFRRLSQEGFDDVDSTSFEDREAEFRAIINDILNGTIPPRFERLFGFLNNDRLAGASSFAEGVRRAKAHLPFSRSGPSQFFVVADGDPFRGDAASPITVDADVNVDGEVEGLVFNPDGNGKFYLGFGPGTDENGNVELIVRETGRFLHGRRGPVRVSIYDEQIFAPVNGEPFAAMVSEFGTFYPGTNVSVIRSDYEPAPLDPTLSDPNFIDGDAPDFEGTTGGEFIDPMLDPNMPPPPPDGSDPLDPTLDPNLDPTGSATQTIDGGPNDQIFVLASGIDANAEPVRVDFDFASGTASYNPGGRNLLMFLPDSHETGMFALFNEDTGRPASADDPINFFQAPPEAPDGFNDFYNETESFDNFGSTDDVLNNFEGDVFLPPPPDGSGPLDPNMPPPPPDGSEPLDPNMPPPDGSEPLDPVLDPNQPVDPASFGGVVDTTGLILVAADSVSGLPLGREAFTFVYGMEVPNERYDASGDPYYDDVNGNLVQDEGEPTAPHRPLLFNVNDWRSTDIRLYYRRADNGLSAQFENVLWESDTPVTLDGVELVPRKWLPRPNAFKFGRPNTAVNLFTAFSPPELFNGTATFSGETRLDIFSALSLINLVMDQVFNVQANIDIDGIGPLPKQQMLVDGHLFVAPLDDPFVLIVKGFRSRATLPNGEPAGNIDPNMPPPPPGDGTDGGGTTQ